MGIIATESKEAAEKFMDNDPTVIAGLNTIEIYPMKAVTKQKVS